MDNNPESTTKTQKHAGGRPPLYKTPEEMQEIIDEYFEWCDNRSKKIYDEKKGVELQISWPAPYTMSGLARRLGMDRRTLVDYAEKDEFLPTIREARNRVQEDVEIRLMETRNEKGAIFNLGNNFGWKNKSETDITSKGEKLEGNQIVFTDFKDAAKG